MGLATLDFLTNLTIVSQFHPIIRLNKKFIYQAYEASIAVRKSLTTDYCLGKNLSELDSKEMEGKHSNRSSKRLGSFLLK